MSSRVIKLHPIGWPETVSRPKCQLPNFTHYCVSVASVRRAKAMLAKLEADAAEARDEYDDQKLIDIQGEMNGMKYTLQALGIPLT